jgi:hypothetical protein
MYKVQGSRKIDEQGTFTIFSNGTSDPYMQDCLLCLSTLRLDSMKLGFLLVTRERRGISTLRLSTMQV